MGTDAPWGVAAVPIYRVFAETLSYKPERYARHRRRSMSIRLAVVGSSPRSLNLASAYTDATLDRLID